MAQAHQTDPATLTAEELQKTQKALAKSITEHPEKVTAEMAAQWNDINAALATLETFALEVQQWSETAS